MDTIYSRLSYDPETGVLTWKNCKNSRFNGREAGYIHTNESGKSYRCVGLDGNRYRAHHIAWFIVHGEFPANEIDHIDGNGTNNKISNLRCVSGQENKRNRRLQSNNLSGVSGVYFKSRIGKWRAVISINGKIRELGDFRDKEKAIATRKRAEKRYGYHENHGKQRPL